MSLFFVDCEAPFGMGAPSVADMTEFGAVEYETLATFHGHDCSDVTFLKFREWINQVNKSGRPVFVSDNPAYDWQWINFYFHKYFGSNPFGHSARRIGDYYAGLVGDWSAASDWKRLRITKHDHNPVNDAMGNAEAFRRFSNGERAHFKKPPARCEYNRYSNTQCMLDKDHDGIHRIPCIDHGAHGAHHEITTAYEVNCQGFSFDRT